MCDTFIAGIHGKAGFRLLAKNSDREPNEAQNIVRIPRAKHSQSNVTCTFITIPQAEETLEVVLSKPFQMWGAEMGMNECGLAIGNEAVFTRIGFKKKNDGLTGMDMVRLALERCKDAHTALDLICSLIETYGQDACGGYENKNFYYHNSFLICDGKEGWVLETADRFWSAKKITESRYAISNGLTLTSDFDISSDGMEDYVRTKGWIKKGEPLNFRKAFSDKLYTHFSKCDVRRSQVSEKANLSLLEDAISVLSSHSHQEPSRTNASSICMHGNSLLNPSVSTGSMIVEFGEIPVCWLTGTSNPCMSVYIPFVHKGQALLDNVITYSAAQPDDTLWWKAEQVHRLILHDYSTLYPLIKDQRNKLQQDIINEFRKLQSIGDVQQMDEFSNKALKDIYHQTNEWLETLQKAEKKKTSSLRYRLYMRGFNRRVGISA